MAIQTMGIENTGFLIEKLASDCSPLQYLRELTTNSIQAIQARQEAGWDGDGEVLWDVDWELLDRTGVYKLSISDNGTGMSADEITRYINQLSSSGRVQDLDKNYGLGAKITAAVHSPAGLVYKTYTGDTGVTAVMAKDEITGNYGLRFLEGLDGDHAHILELDLSAPKANPIRDFGTQVTMFGSAEEEHTFLPPGIGQKWVTKYLNNRYFKFPPKVTVKVRNFRKTDPEGWPTSPDQTMSDDNGSQFRVIQGMEYNLQRNSESSGTVKTQKGKIHWWILNEDIGTQTDIWESRAHSAILFQDELYEFNSATTRLRDFGVILGTKRVVIYVEPDERSSRITPLTSRASLQIDQLPVNWQYWTREFRNQMPEEIKAMMDKIAQASGQKSHEEALRKWLKTLGVSFRFHGIDSTPKERTKLEELPLEETRVSSKPPMTTPDLEALVDGEDLLRRYTAPVLKAGGARADAIRAGTNVPEVKWLTVDEGSRGQGDLEDRAARYLPIDHEIHINGDFRVFNDLINMMVEEGNLDPDSDQHKVIIEIVKAQITVQLVETVMGTLALRGSREWPDDVIQKALSEEGLTAAAMQRSGIIQTARRSISGKLGSRKEATSVK